MELLMDLPKLHWSLFVSSVMILLIPVLVAIAMYCNDICGGLRIIDTEDVDEEELYRLWYLSELLESCEILLDSDSHEELVDY